MDSFFRNQATDSLVIDEKKSNIQALQRNPYCQGNEIPHYAWLLVLSYWHLICKTI